MPADIPVRVRGSREIKAEITRFMMYYKFALQEVETKIDILNQKFQFENDYKPIDNLKSRVMSPDKILRKVNKKGIDFTLDAIKTELYDVARVRVTCRFIPDIYEISRMLLMQKDIKVVDYKDYIKYPKQNGYRSLHLIIQVPVYMSDVVEYVNVEVQIRTVAMDFWAKAEHQLCSKYASELPMHIELELREAAHSASIFDEKMEFLHKEMTGQGEGEEDLSNIWFNDEKFHLPHAFLRMGG